jgi:hypothetical protein
MQYALLIYSDEKEWEGAPEAARSELIGKHVQLYKELQASGKMVSGQPLRSTTTATTVHVRDGKTLITDGPFAETKEQLGGFYLIEAEDLDEALRWASHVPHIGDGCVEVRPVGE